MRTILTLFVVIAFSALFACQGSVTKPNQQKNNQITSSLSGSGGETVETIPVVVPVDDKLVEVEVEVEYVDGGFILDGDMFVSYDLNAGSGGAENTRPMRKINLYCIIEEYGMAKVTHASDGILCQQLWEHCGWNAPGCTSPTGD